MNRTRSQILDVTSCRQTSQVAGSQGSSGLNYAEAFPEEIEEAIAENQSADFESLKRMLPQAVDSGPRKTKQG